jgi:hypothetical protein
MATGIISLLVTIAGLVAWLIKRKLQRDDDPKVQLQKKLDENDNAIARGDVNDLLDDRLRNTHPNNRSGQDSNAPATK